MADDYAIIGIFLLIGLGFVLVTFFIARLLRPHRPSPVKLESYECGEHIMGSSWIQYNVGYYIFALIFVVFDLEAVFLFPIAAALNQLAFFAVFEVILFVLILAVGLAYAWRKDALEWF